MSYTKIDLSTEAGVHELTTGIMARAKHIYAKHQQLPRCLVCLAKHWEGIELPSPVPVWIVEDGESGDELSARFHKAARESQALGVYFFSEAWLVDFATAEERVEWSRRDLSEHPRAYEALHMTLEHRTFGNRAWMARIRRDGAGKATVGDFEERAQSFVGRMAGFLPFASKGEPNAS